MTTILDRIIVTKREEVAESKRRRAPEAVREAALAARPPRNFAAAITPRGANDIRLIGEIKKASPSAGVIVADFDAAAIAREYQKHGAAALSVLTDETYFQGHLKGLDEVKAAVDLPVLRKDFIVDEYQVYESRAAGADAVLLIAEVLGAAGVAAMLPAAAALRMTALVEVHTEENLRAVLAQAGMPARGHYWLGINNRDLTHQRTDVTTFSRLAGLVPRGSPLVAESGIQTRADVEKARAAGAWAVLVGESILRSADRGARIQELLGRKS